MEGKQVPWWRKALNLALNGIRSGFGLFSRPQKHTDEIEPETVAGHEEIREEEAELTEHSPELNPSEAEAVSPIEAEVEPNDESVATGELTNGVESSAESVAAHELTADVEPAIEAQPEQSSVPEAEVEIEAPVVEGAPEANIEAPPDAPVEAPVSPEEESSETEPTDEDSVADLAPESMVEIKTDPVTEPVAEIVQLKAEPASEPVQESVATVADVAEAEPAADVQVDEVAAAANLSPENENGMPASDEDVQEPREASESIFEAPAIVSDTELDTVMPNSDVQSAEGTDAGILEVPVQDPPVEQVIEDGFEQVTEQQVTVENVLVDEVAPQAESAISEDSAPESASPVPEELIEPAPQAAEESSEEPIEVAAPDASDLNAEEIVSETTESAETELVEQDEIVDQSTEQITEVIADEAVDQAIEQPMELDHSNSEPAAEQEKTADTPSPIPAAEEPANAPDAPAEEPVSVDEPAAVAAAPHPSKPFIKLEAKEGEVNASPFSVIVSQVYDGPLDLLLDLIRKQDIDIYDIPIARITAQFLAYVNQLKASDVDVAGEFIYTASLLIHIKSKMLLPRAPSGSDDASEDPRRELVERLLEHERFKNAAQMLQQKQMLEAATVTNPGVREFKEDAGAEPEIAADTVDLVRVFREILDRARNRPILNVEEDSVTVGQMIQFLSRRLSMEDHPIALRKLLSHSRSERALIAMFLALLELVRLQAILLRQDLAFSEIFIKKHSNFEAVMNESVAHDEWR